MAAATRTSIGLLGYGEAGKILAEESARHSHAAVRAYDILFLAPAFFVNSAQAAASVGVTAVAGA